MEKYSLVLASKSRIRREILDGAGLSFRHVDAKVNEASIKNTLLSQKQPLDLIAERLALAKANAVTRTKLEIVIAADQIMEMDGQLYDKPKSIAEAKSRLKLMRGKEHRLIGCVCTLHGNKEIWTYISKTILSVRNFSDSFLDDYLEKEGEEVLFSVGGYKFEGRGSQLFSSVEGDFFSILGLSLLPLLDRLRDIKAIPS